MAGEARVHSTLTIRKQSGSVVVMDYRHAGGVFTADVDGTFGPTPGAFQVSTSGTDVDLSKLTTPGLCRITNLDSTNYVSFGTYDPDTDVYAPVGEVLPGESYVIRLSRFLARELTGTGTLPGSNASLRFVAQNSPVNVLVEAFEK